LYRYVLYNNLLNNIYPKNKIKKMRMSHLI
jgi:hypothetical protein